MKNNAISYLIPLHFSRYPNSQLQDFCKLLFQHTFGPGHLAQDEKKSLAYLQTEARQASSRVRLYDPIGNGLARIHLSNGLSSHSLVSLNRAFLVAASSVRGNTQQLKQALSVLKLLCGNQILPFSRSDAEAFCSQWEADGFPALHHSARYRKTYAPAYRIVPIEYPRYLPMFDAVDQMLSQKGRCILAIDGDSGAGKTTLARLLHQMYHCTVIHMDDFFLPASRKAKERLEIPGGNVDWERFLSEIAPAFQNRQSISYRRFDCHHQTLNAPVSLPLTPLVVVEGSYSHHPKLRHLYDLTMFLSLSAPAQQKRIAARSPSLLPRFLAEWIPLEKAYQAAYSISSSSTFSFSAEDELPEEI